jgi:hypothetical protein
MSYTIEERFADALIWSRQAVANHLAALDREYARQEEANLTAALARQEEANLTAALARQEEANHAAALARITVDFMRKRAAHNTLESVENLIAQGLSLSAAALIELYASNPADQRLRPFVETTTTEYVDENGTTITTNTTTLDLSSL